MPRRFYLPQSLQQSEVALEGAEARHLLRVLRMGVGDQVLLFDGTGTEALATIEAASERSARLRIIEVRAAASETLTTIILGTAVPKGDRFSWLVEKATEVGVARLVPLNTDRSIVDPGAGKLDKMRQTVIAASKQCGRSRLMEIDAPTSFRAFVEREFATGTPVLAHPSGDQSAIEMRPISGPFILTVGPEGGFTAGELELACEKGGRLFGLGPRILRIETAALAMAVLFAQGRAT